MKRRRGDRKDHFLINSNSNLQSQKQESHDRDWGPHTLLSGFYLTGHDIYKEHVTTYAILKE